MYDGLLNSPVFKMHRGHVLKTREHKNDSRYGSEQKKLMNNWHIITEQVNYRIRSSCGIRKSTVLGLDMHSRVARMVCFIFVIFPECQSIARR